jgi:hypothetical protein
MSGPLRLTLAVRNTTGASAPVYTANADPVSAARALDALRRAQARGLATPARTVSITDSARPAKERVLAPLQVTGTIAFPGRRVVIDDAAGARVHGATARFVARLDEGTPAARVSLRGRVLQTGPPQVRLVVTPVTVDPALRPPASTWVEAVRRGRVRQSGRELLRRAISLDLAYTRARQYETFLRAPDPRSANTTSYVFRVAAPPSPATATPRPAAPARGGSALVLIVGVATGLLAAAGVVVAWAHL